MPCHTLTTICIVRIGLRINLCFYCGIARNNRPGCGRFFLPLRRNVMLLLLVPVRSTTVAQALRPTNMIIIYCNHITEAGYMTRTHELSLNKRALWIISIQRRLSTPSSTDLHQQADRLIRVQVELRSADCVSSKPCRAVSCHVDRAWSLVTT